MEFGQQPMKGYLIVVPCDLGLRLDTGFGL